ATTPVRGRRLGDHRRQVLGTAVRQRPQARRQARPIPRACPRLPRNPPPPPDRRPSRLAVELARFARHPSPPRRDPRPPPEVHHPHLPYLRNTSGLVDAPGTRV